MRCVEREDAFVEDHFPDLAPVRQFKDCRVWTAGSSPLLLIVEDGLTRRVAIYEYDTAEERERAIERIRRMPDGDDGQAGVPAVPEPPSPGPHSPGFRQQLPKR